VNFTILPNQNALTIVTGGKEGKKGQGNGECLEFRI
jgi:hypothetical protein